MRRHPHSLQVRDATLVGAYPLLLLAGEAAVDHSKQSVTLDGWLKFSAPPRTAVLLRELRAELDGLLLEKVRPASAAAGMGGRGGGGGAEPAETRLGA